MATTDALCWSINSSSAEFCTWTVCLSVHDSTELQVFSWWTDRSVASCSYLKAFAFEAHVDKYEHDAHETQGWCWCTLCAVRYLTSYRPNYKLTVNSHNENILKISQHSGRSYEQWRVSVANCRCSASPCMTIKLRAAMSTNRLVTSSRCTRTYTVNIHGV